MLAMSESDIRQAVTARDVVDSQDLAFRVSVQPDRVRRSQMYFDAFAPDSMAFAHSAIAQGATGVVFKSGTQYPRNHSAGIPTVNSTVTVHAPETGEALGVLNGNTITALRTAGGLVSAARALAVTDPLRVAVLGSGVQAAELVLLLNAVMPVVRFVVWSPRAESRARVREDRRLHAVDVTLTGSAQQACEESNVIATCTSSRTPVVEGRWVQPGTTLLTMGCYEPDRREIDLETSDLADVTVLDSAESAGTVGPFREAVDASVLDVGDAVMLGDVLAGSRAARDDAQDVIIFHSKGLGVQDATLAWVAYTNARSQGLGSEIKI